MKRVIFIGTIIITSALIQANVRIINETGIPSMVNDKNSLKPLPGYGRITINLPSRNILAVEFPPTTTLAFQDTFSNYELLKIILSQLR